MIEPLSSCDLCRGSGWVTEAGSLQARPCKCQVTGRKKVRVTAASIPRRYEHCTFANFHERGNGTLLAARRRAAEFADVWPMQDAVNDRGLLLMGGCGSGKTHLAVAVLQSLIADGKPGKLLFSNFQDLIQEIQASFDPSSDASKGEILQPLLDADLLVLDELGSQKPTPFVQDILYYIINSRYNDAKFTIFTTNYFDSPSKGEERLEDRIGERLRSRLAEMADRIVLEAEDYRRRTMRVV